MSDEGGEGGSRRGALVGLVVVIVVVAAVVLLIGRLRESGRMQDCLASGRTNCAPVEAPPR